MLHATIEGIGFWATGLPGWDSVCSFLRDGQLADAAPARPAPQLLAANERRRAPGTVAVALEAALAACQAAGRAPDTLPAVFSSCHGELAITDYMCTTLANDPLALSPTRFHNSVHNAAVGYWTIGAGAHVAATALSAGAYSFAQGLLEALAQLHAGEPAVLLAAYDGEACGPLADISPSQGLLGTALVLSRSPAAPGQPQLTVTLQSGRGSATAPGRLTQLLAGNAMAPALPLLEALATGQHRLQLPAAADQHLQIDIRHG